MHYYHLTLNKRFECILQRYRRATFRALELRTLRALLLTPFTVYIRCICVAW